MQEILVTVKHSSITRILLLATVLSFIGCKMEYTDVVFHGIVCCQAGEAKDGKLKIGFALDVENPNKFNIRITDYDVDVMLNGIKVGQAKSKQDIVLKKQERNEYPLTVDADIGKVLSGSLLNLGSLFGAGKPKAMEATISGKIRASVHGVGRSIPVSGTYPINLNSK